MGPRSDERGNKTRLQLYQEITGNASMGPRSDERGNREASQALQNVQPASMGPRSDERGNKIYIDKN